MKKAFALLVLGAPLLVAGSATAGTAVVQAFPGSTGAGGALTALGSGVVTAVSFQGARGASLSWRDASGTTMLASGIAGRTGEAFAIGNGRAIVSFVESGVAILPTLRVRKTFWSTDGTVAGTFQLPVPGAEGTSGVQGTSVQIVDGGAVFSGVPTDTGSWEAWWSDGSVAGTHRIGSMCAESIGLVALGAAGSRAYASGSACDTSNAALYVVDSSGLSVLDLGSFSSQVASWNAVGSTVLFDVNQGASWQWWRGDGASLPTADANAHDARRYTSVWGLGGASFAATSSAIVAADDGDSVVAAVSSGSLLGIAGRQMIFAGGASDGRALWSSDGTPSGTTSLGQIIDPGSFAPPRPVVEYSAVGTAASSVLFFANVRGSGNLPSRDRELWATDGTTAGTRQLFAKSGGPYLQPTHVMVSGASIFLFDGNVWRSDGTVDGTAQIATTSGQSVDVATAGETLYMLVGSPSGGNALWTWTADASPSPPDGGAPNPGGLDGGSAADGGSVADGGVSVADGGGVADGGVSDGGARADAALPHDGSVADGSTAAPPSASAPSTEDEASEAGSISSCSLGARSKRGSQGGVGMLLLGLALMIRRRAR